MGLKRYACPHKQQAAAHSSDAVGGTVQAEAAAAAVVDFSIQCFLPVCFVFQTSTCRVLKRSLNINGWKDRQNWALIAEVSTLKNTNVLFLQETHSNPADEADWRLVAGSMCPQSWH